MRYLRLYRAFFINNVSRAMEFRAQFFASIIGYALWTGISLVFLQAVFGSVHAVRGWNKDQMWVLYGTFVVLESFCYGALGPNMWRFSGMIREGTLDLALTRPVNVQFFVSSRYLDLNGLLNAFIGLVLIFLGLSRIGHWPNALDWLIWALHLIAGFTMAYSLWFIVVVLSIWAVKLEAIAVAFDPMMQMARFPLNVYPKRMWTFLTIVFPVAFLTTYPTKALLGQGNLWTLLTAGALATVMLTASNLWFRFALRSYGSAST